MSTELKNDHWDFVACQLFQSLWGLPTHLPVTARRQSESDLLDIRCSSVNPGCVPACAQFTAASMSFLVLAQKFSSVLQVQFLASDRDFGSVLHLLLKVIKGFCLLHNIGGLIKKKQQLPIVSSLSKACQWTTVQQYSQVTLKIGVVEKNLWKVLFANDSIHWLCSILNTAKKNYLLNKAFLVVCFHEKKMSIWVFPHCSHWIKWNCKNKVCQIRMKQPNQMVTF